MKTITSGIIAMTVSALVGGIATAQNLEAAGPSSTDILGYLDLKTGAFRPVAARAPESTTVTSTAVAATEYAGTIEFTADITIYSPSITTSTPIYCTAQISMNDAGGNNPPFVTVSENASALATRSGNHAQCTVKVPYFWLLKNQNNYDLVPLVIGVVAGSSEMISAGLARTSSRVTYSFHLPKYGATTSFVYTFYL